MSIKKSGSAAPISSGGLVECKLCGRKRALQQMVFVPPKNPDKSAGWYECKNSAICPPPVPKKAKPKTES